MSVPALVAQFEPLAADRCQDGRYIMAPAATFTTTTTGGLAATTARLAPLMFPTLTPAQLARLPHDNEGPRLTVILWMFNILAAIFLAVRLYSKYRRHRALWWDDHILIAAWLAIVGAAVTAMKSIENGYGKHTYDITPDQLAKLPLLANISGTFAVFAALWSKTSFAVTLLFLLRQTHRRMRIVVWVIIVTMNIAMMASAIMLWTGCTPIEKGWNYKIPGTCAPIERLVTYNIFSAAYSAAMDLVLAFLPWKLLWSLQMKKAEKIGVCIAMSMGVFAAMTSFIKVAYISTMDSRDIFDGIPLIIWGAAESSVTIMAASVPIMRHLLVRRPRVHPPPSYDDHTPPALEKMDDNFELQTRSTVTIESITSRSSGHHGYGHGHGHGSKGRGASISSWISWKPETRSNRNSMEMHLPADGKIVEIHEVSVEYDEKTVEERAREARLAVPAFRHH